MVAVWYMMWNNIGRIEENRSSMAIMPEEWSANNADSDGSTSSREVQFYRINIFVFTAKPAGLWIAITGH